MTKLQDDPSLPLDDESVYNQLRKNEYERDRQENGEQIMSQNELSVMESLPLRRSIDSIDDLPGTTSAPLGFTLHERAPRGWSFVRDGSDDVMTFYPNHGRTVHFQQKLVAYRKNITGVTGNLLSVAQDHFMDPTRGSEAFLEKSIVRRHEVVYVKTFDSDNSEDFDGFIGFTAFSTIGVFMVTFLGDFTFLDGLEYTYPSYADIALDREILQMLHNR